MDRFVAFVWEADRPDQMRQVSRWHTELKAKNPAWTIALDGEGLLVLALPDGNGDLPVCTLATDAGIAIGTIFRASDAERGRLKALPADSTERIVASQGQELLRSYWGSFVSIVRDAVSDAVHIVRDPCGASACYHARAKGITLLCSFADDIADLSRMNWSIDWGAIQSFLVSNYLINPRTGLRELTEVMPGQRMTLRPGLPIETQYLWSPIELAQTVKQQSFAQACEAFRAVAERCVSSWSQAAGHIVVRLSGGLDSSIVAALARQSSTTMSGVHFVGRGYEAYELKLAREVAAHLDFPLDEKEFDQATVSFRGAGKGPRIARPTKQLLGSDANAKLRQACEAAGAQTVFSGHGGDAVFLQRAIAGDALVDYLLSKERKTGRLVAVAYDTAMLLETSVWHVAGAAVSKRFGHQRWDPDGPAKEGRAAALRDFASETFFDFPPGSTTSAWLEEARNLPPCKAEQIRSLLALRNYHATRGHALSYRSIHPLISQPLIELSLQTPAHLFNTGGADRALERAAFRDLMPEAVVRRFHKGFVNHSVIASIVSDLDYIRELVLDGRCADHGLLDRTKVDRLLSKEQLLEGQSFVAVMDLIAVESWLNAWLD